jgi:hypothetical protein
MTCLEKYLQIHPGVDAEDVYIGSCPFWDNLTDSDKPDYCGKCDDDCERCWNREIPGTEVEKENEKMPVNAIKPDSREMTKEQMLMEIKNAHATIHEMEDRLKNLERYKQCEEMADELKAVHTAFMNSGFSDEQAYDMLKILIGATLPGVMKGLF